MGPQTGPIFLPVSDKFLSKTGENGCASMRSAAHSSAFQRVGLNLQR